MTVHLGGLDATMERSVGAFIETRHGSRFAIADLVSADVVLVDLDQPSAETVLAAATGRQVVVGVGFDPQPRRDGCRRYVQKPLSGGVLVNALAEAAALVGTRPAAVHQIRIDRPSHARDLFTKGRAWNPAPDRPAATRPPAARLERDVHDRPLRLVEVATPGATSGSAAEALERRLEMEAVEARSGGDLRDPAVLRSYRYAPADHLDGLLRQVALRHAGERWELRSPLLTLVADPADDTVLVSGSDTRLHGCCAVPLEAGWEVRTLRRAPTVGNQRRVPLEELRWNVAVWCSQGRLPDTIDPFAPVASRTWPNLTRCVLTPSVMPVIALLAGAPHPPADVADALGIPRTHAFVALAALDALDLLEHRSEPATEPTSIGTVERGVLRRLLGRLRVA